MKVITSLIITVLVATSAAAEVKTLYMKHCSACHLAERYGLTGPPLLPEYFGRKKEAEIKDIISNGLPATNMPAFKDTLKQDEIAEIASFISQPVESPHWGMDDMLGTLSVAESSGTADIKPQFDMTDFFMVVEGGAGKVHFMDGETFTLRGQVRVGAIHGGPKFSRDLKHSYIIGRDGWLVKYDIITFKEKARIRTAISTRNIAVSSDSRLVAQTNLLPNNIVIIDAETMKPLKIIEHKARLGAVYNLRTKKKFVAGIQDENAILLIDEDTLETKTLKTDQPFTDFFIDNTERFLIGSSRDSERLSIIDIETGGTVKTIKIASGMPHLASAAIWSTDNKTFAAFPHIGKSLVTIMELYTWEIKAEVRIKGPGFFARTHDCLSHIWVDTGTDTIELINKQTFENEKTLVPEAGKKAMHIEFSKDGRNALISVWEDDGAVKIYDTKTLELVKTLPFKKPVGKYNATNKRF
ncbi:MAG: c-type cytochrome [Deltaproteobacteria bacterium]|nr:c-type cytochrome [Deltaproteobacteria bacterium]